MRLSKSDNFDRSLDNRYFAYLCDHYDELAAGKPLLLASQAIAHKRKFPIAHFISAIFLIFSISFYFYSHNSPSIAMATDGTISGTIYTAEDKSTNIGANQTVALSIAGGAKTTVETDASGQFSFSGQAYTAGNTIAIFLDDEADKASFVTVAADSSEISGLELYPSTIKLSHLNSGPITNTILGSARVDSDQEYSVSSGDAIFSDGQTLFLEASKTYTPGGAVTVDNLNIEGTLSMVVNALTISGNLTNSGTISSTGSITFDATRTGNNIDSSGNWSGNLIFNGVGGEWTLKSPLAITSLTVTNGTLIDNSQTVTVYGNIDISRGDPALPGLISTGNWILAANGTIRSETGECGVICYGNWRVGGFKELRIADSITATIKSSETVSLEKLILGTSSQIINSAYLVFYTYADNFIVQGPGSNITGGLMRFYPRDDAGLLSQGSLNLDTELCINYGRSTYKMTGDWSLEYLGIFSSVGYSSESDAMVLDTNGFNLTVAGNLALGMTYQNYSSRYAAKILFRSGNHSIGGSFLTLFPNAGGGTTSSFIDFGTSTIKVSGDIGLNEYTNVSGANNSTLILDGTKHQVVTAEIPLHNLIVSNTSVDGINFLTDLTLDGTFSDTAPGSKITFKSGGSYNFKSVNINGYSTATRVSLLSSVPGQPWYLTIPGGSADISYVRIRDGIVSPSVNLIGSEDLGGNSNWNFLILASLPATGIGY